MIKRKKMDTHKIYKKDIQTIKHSTMIENNPLKEDLFSFKDDIPLEEGSKYLIDFISALSIEFWRLKKRIQDAKIDEEKIKESIYLSPIIDQIQRIVDILKKYNIEICNHNGENYNDGKALKVLHIEEMEEIPSGKMKIIETIKPTIYLNGKVIFFGEVIIGKSKDKRKKE